MFLLVRKRFGQPVECRRWYLPQPIVIDKHAPLKTRKYSFVLGIVQGFRLPFASPSRQSDNQNKPVEYLAAKTGGYYDAVIDIEV